MKWGRFTRRGAALAAGAVAVLVILESLVVFLLHRVEESKLAAEATRSFVRGGEVSDRFVLDADGVRQPGVVPTSRAVMRDDEPVVGVVAGGRARAYRLAAMRFTNTHVLNDLVGGSPVSVTYCDLTDCVRAFTKQLSREPLEIRQGGLKGGKMVLTIGDRSFLQQTGEPVDGTPSDASIPYEPLTVQRTTWREWRSAHPNGDVFVGLPENPIP